MCTWSLASVLHELVEAFSSGGHLLEIRDPEKRWHLQKVEIVRAALRDIPLILGHRLLFCRLRALRDKLCFRNTHVIAALKIISEQRCGL